MVDSARGAGEYYLYFTRKREKSPYQTEPAEKGFTKYSEKKLPKNFSGSPACQKSFVEFAPLAGQTKSNLFLRRHARRKNTACGASVELSAASSGGQPRRRAKCALFVKKLRPEFFDGISSYFTWNTIFPASSSSAATWSPFLTLPASISSASGSSSSVWMDRRRGRAP